MIYRDLYKKIIQIAMTSRDQVLDIRSKGDSVKIGSAEAMQLSKYGNIFQESMYVITILLTSTEEEDVFR